MSYTQLLYHIVFRTKDRSKTIPESSEKDLYAYIWGMVKARNSKLYQIGGMEDHLHLLVDLHPEESLARFVSEIKASSSKWLKNNPNFPDFEGWGEGYAAFSYGIKELPTVRAYIQKQKEHHKTISFENEYRDFILKHGLDFYADKSHN